MLFMHQDIPLAHVGKMIVQECSPLPEKLSPPPPTHCPHDCFPREYI